MSKLLLGPFPMRKCLVALRISLAAGMALYASASASPPVSKHTQQCLGVLVRALNGHKLTLLEPVLAPGFKVGHLSGETAREALAQVVGSYPREIKSYAVQSEVQQANGDLQVEVVFHCSDGARTNRFRLNPAGLFTELGLISPRDDFHPQATDCPAVVKLPIRLSFGLVLITATVNGKTGSFLLDTGTQCMTLNSARFPASGIQKDAVLHLGAQGASVSRSRVHVSEFRMGELRYSSFDSASQDLEYLGKALDTEILGIIGFDQLSDFESLFDYTKGTLTLYTLDAAGRRISKEKGIVPAARIPFELVGHIPVIKGRIGSLKVSFAIDTGLSANVINQALRAKPEAGFKTGKLVNVLAVRGAAAYSEAGLVAEIEAGERHYSNMATLVSNMPPIAESTGHQFSAMLGYPFLRMQPVSINYRSQILSVWHPTQP